MEREWQRLKSIIKIIKNKTDWTRLMKKVKFVKRIIKNIKDWKIILNLKKINNNDDGKIKLNAHVSEFSCVSWRYILFKMV